MSKDLAARPDQGLASMNLQPAIEAAVALGKDGAEVLERILHMRREERADMARAAFHAAMADLHARLDSIPKNRTANFNTKSGATVSYRYADLHAIATTLRKHTGDLGLSWKWSTEYADNSEIVTCTASHRDGHSESATWRAPIESGNPMTSAPQKAKIATTFAQRVTLIQVFGLTDTEDDVDGHMPRSDDGPPATISDEAAANMRATLEEIGADVPAFLRYMRVDAIEDIPEARAKQAWGAIEKKRKAAR